MPPPPQPKSKQQGRFHQSGQIRHFFSTGWLPSQVPKFLPRRPFIIVSISLKMTFSGTKADIPYVNVLAFYCIGDHGKYD